MHICYLCNEYPPVPHGGIGSVTQTIARAVTARGHMCTVLGIYTGISSRAEEWDGGVRVIRLPHCRIPRMGFLLSGAALRKAMNELHAQSPIDVVEGQENALAMMDPRFPATTVVRMHGGHHFFSVTLGQEPKPWRSWVEKRSFARARRLCAVSSYVAETTRGLVGLGSRPITVIPNPVNVDTFRPRPDIAEDPNHLLFLGTVTEKKGVRQLVEAMPQILQAVPGAHLTIAGRDRIDPTTGRSFADELQSRIPQSVRERISFVGAVPRDRMPELIARAAVCVLPSHMEALPMSWLEVLASGKPLIASDIGPAPEVVQPGVSGILCNPHDPASIAAATVRLLLAPDKRRAMGLAARAHAVQNFSLNVLAQTNIRFYESCCRQEKHLAASAF